MLQKQGTEEWLSCQEVRRDAKARPTEIGDWQVCKTRKTAFYRLITYRKRRKLKRTTKSQADSYSIRSYKASSLEPWLLLTSLSVGELDAAAVVRLYGQRMQIEENFRDLKSHRFGWSMRYVRSGSADRLAVLLLIATLAMLATLLLGQLAERKGHHRRYQSNTVSHRRVLSFCTLGNLMLQRHDVQWLQPHDIHHELCFVRELFRQLTATQSVADT